MEDFVLLFMFSIRVLHRISVQYHDFRGVYTWRKLLVVDFRRLQADYSELMADVS
jgi:hypothetical protein